MEFAVIDVETTGLNHTGHDRVIEVGIVRVDSWGTRIAEYETLINPGRDLGPTHIHGINAWEVLDAPTFADVAGDIEEILDGAVLASHNARFDHGFLTAELRRAGLPAPQGKPMCTLELLYAVEPYAPRRLHDCCTHLGLPTGEAHRAITDARMAAALLTHLLALWSYPAIPDPTTFPARPAASHRSLIRGSQRPLVAQQGDYLAKLLSKLPTGAPVLSQAAEAAEYLNIIDRVLEDRRLTAEEAELMVVAADTFGLSRDELAALHRQYVQLLVTEALLDGVVTAAERRDLSDVSSILAVPDWEELLDDARQTISFAPPRPEQLVDDRRPLATESPSKVRRSGQEILVRTLLEPFDGVRSAPGLPAGTTICFTGAMERGSREEIEDLARSFGLVVKANVSGKVQVLVIADPDSQSGKARKARELGTRLLSEAAFFSLLVGG